MTDKLRDCPFCGSDTVTGESRILLGKKAIRVSCRCGAMGPWMETLKESNEAWNRRAAPAPAPVFVAGQQECPAEASEAPSDTEDDKMLAWQKAAPSDVERAYTALCAFGLDASTGAVTFDAYRDYLAALLAAVRAEERERCAKIFDTNKTLVITFKEARDLIRAAAIRGTGRVTVRKPTPDQLKRSRVKRESAK